MPQLSYPLSPATLHNLLFWPLPKGTGHWWYNSFTGRAYHHFDIGTRTEIPGSLRLIFVTCNIGQEMSNSHTEWCTIGKERQRGSGQCLMRQCKHQNKVFGGQGPCATARELNILKSALQCDEQNAKQRGDHIHFPQNYVNAQIFRYFNIMKILVIRIVRNV